MHVNKRSGYHVKSNNFHIHIDPTSVKGANEADLILISHAHTDHIKSIERIEPLKILSQATKDVIFARNKKAHGLKNYHIIDPNDPDKNVYEINKKLKITAHPAGHCIGSLQFLVEGEKDKVLYTGDFNCEKRIGFETGHIHEIKDGKLIIDGTYNNPIYQFKERKALYQDIWNWMRLVFKKRNNIFLIGRQLGTCQELTSLINYSRFSKVCKVYAHPSVYKINCVHHDYSSLGLFEQESKPIEDCIKLNKFEPENRNQKTLTEFIPGIENNSKPNGQKRSIYLLPFYFTSKMKELTKLEKKQVAIFTGWAKNPNINWFSNIQTFPLTSHAGYDHIQKYRKECKASQVYYL